MKFGRYCKKWGVMTLFLCGLLIAAALGNWLFTAESGYPPKADAIVVLAGKYEERIPAAISLYRAGSANLILLTNGGAVETWYEELQTNLPEMVCSEKLLLKNGIPQQSIVKLPFLKSGTVYDARAVRSYIKEHPLNYVLVVTSNYHARRARWIFERALNYNKNNFSVVPVASGRSSAVPIALEPLKTIYYRLRYGFFEKP